MHVYEKQVLATFIFCMEFLTNREIIKMNSDRSVYWLNRHGTEISRNSVNFYVRRSTYYVVARDIHR